MLMPPVFVVLVVALPVSAVSGTTYLTAVIIGLLVVSLMIALGYGISALFLPSELGIQMFNITVGAP